MAANRPQYCLLPCLVWRIGILAVVAIPAYQDYIRTANMTKVNTHYEEAVRVARATYLRDRTQTALGLAGNVPTDAAGWINLFDRNGVDAPGGGAAYLPENATGDDDTGAIGVVCTDAEQVTISRPAYEDLTFAQVIVVAADEI